MSNLTPLVKQNQGHKIRNMALKLFYRKIPQSPGVYFFKDNRGKTLYIGKAANLHARLRSRILPKKTKSISWEVLNSEVEALIREAELIKKYRPKYKVALSTSLYKFPKIHK